MALKSNMNFDSDSLFSTASEERKEEKIKQLEEERKLKHQNTKSLDETTEAEMILDRKVVCKNCDKQITYKSLKTSKVRRMESGPDLRQGVDTLKYEVIACPNCGYAAMTRYYEHISLAQLKLIKEQITANFEREDPWPEPVYTYDYAVERYELALACAVAKKGKVSERAFICLHLAWLLKAKLEEMEATDPNYEKTKAEAEKYYRQAYDGFLKAMTSEYYPMCGMDQYTMEYMIAYMSYYFKEITISAKLISGIITNKNVSKRLKDRALLLKEQMMADIKSGRIQLKK